MALRQRLESEKNAREKAEAERKRLEEELARMRAAQEKEAQGIILILKSMLNVKPCCFSFKMTNGNTVSK